MYAFKSIFLILVVCCAAVACADEIVSWGDGGQGTEWDWIPAENTLEGELYITSDVARDVHIRMMQATTPTRTPQSCKSAEISKPTWTSTTP